MNTQRRLVLAVVLVAAATIGISIGKISTAPAAQASAAHVYSLRVGDKVTIPAVDQHCAVFKEGGAPELLLRATAAPAPPGNDLPGQHPDLEGR